MPLHRTRVGVHARNAVQFTDHDYAMVRRARIETIKMMSMTDPAVFSRLRQECPDIEFIVRLYDDRLHYTSRSSPDEFVSRMVPLINGLQPFAMKFEIHNEPNHAEGVEGWGASDENARSFRAWYLAVLPALRAACPWAQFGFPGLALNAPHRDLEWLEICADAIRASDWLGCHCYWQFGNMMKDQWGLRFKLYNARFPRKRIEITEFGNSTPNLPAEDMARQYVQYYAELNRYPYLGSASAFIASSPDNFWAPFVWLKEGGDVLPVVEALANMERRAVETPQWPPVSVPPVTQPPVTQPPITQPPVTQPPVTQPPVTKPPVTQPPVVTAPTERIFAQTGKTVRGSFLQFFDQYGLDVCGYPITDQVDEAGMPAQYFQRVGLEEPKAGKIRLKLVGTEAWESRNKIADLTAQIEGLKKRPPAAGGTQPPIEDITGQLPAHASKRYPTRPLADIKQIVIHHTGTSPTITPQRLAEYQVRQLDKPGITYHFVVAADGTIYQTNKLEIVSDHAFAHNQDSVGVVFPGNFTDSIPTDAQIKAGGQLVAWLLATLHLAKDKVVGLGEFVNTQSPGKQWKAGQRWKDKLLAAVDEAGIQVAAPPADQSELIATLRAEIAGLQAKSAALQAEIERLKKQPAPPAPGAGHVAQPPIQDITDQLPRDPQASYPTRAVETIKQIVIHHTGTSPTITPQRLAEYQVRQLKKPAIATHYFIAADGTIYQTNKLKTVSDHAFARNPEAVGVVFPGNFTDTIPTDAQIKAGGQLVACLLDGLKLDKSAIVGLSEFVNTQSPGKQWKSGQRWKDKLLAAVDEASANVVGPAPDQSAVIAALRAENAGLQARVAALQAEIERLKKQPATPTQPTPPTPLPPIQPVPPTPTPPTPTPPGNGKVTRPPIQDIIGKLPTHSTKHYNTRQLSAIQTLVIHHSDVPPTVGAQRIAQYHVQNLDWPGIGYHFLVGADGVVYQTNNLQTVSYHAAKANPRTVGICFLGNFTTEVPPQPQLAAGAHLVAWLMQELDVPLDEIKGHQEVLATACPGAQWLRGKRWKDMLRQAVLEAQQAASRPAPVPGPTPVPVRDGKVLKHYMLFWQRPDVWPKQDWANAQNYIGAFRPTAGFSADEACRAEFVTIVGGPLGTSKQTEEMLKTAGCKVDRIAGKDEADTKRMLDDLAARGKRFLSFEG